MESPLSSPVLLLSSPPFPSSCNNSGSHPRTKLEAQSRATTNRAQVFVLLHLEPVLHLDFLLREIIPFLHIENSLRFLLFAAKSIFQVHTLKTKDVSYGTQISRQFRAGCPSGGVSLVAQLVKNPPANAGQRRETRDEGGIPGWVRLPGEGNGNPLQYPCLENPMDRGAWQASVYGDAKSRTRPRN